MSPKIKLTRIIHPVGQGGFYTERFYKENENVLNVVYDCGTDKDTSYLQGIIKGVFPQTNDNKQVIHYLFISHFHEDHINGVKFLLDQYEVQYIVIPAIQNKDILLCDYFHNIIRSEDIDNNGNWLLEQIFSEPNSERLLSANLIRASNKIQLAEQSWEYIPFCIESGQWKKFVEKFKKEFPTVYSAFDGHNFLVLKNLVIGNPEDFDRLKKLYKDYYKDPQKNDNYYSMAVLSTPKDGEKEISSSVSCFKRINSDNTEDVVSAKDVMCLYTGDFPARDINCLDNLKNYYTNYWDNFKTLQVPHHGSRYDNPKELYDIQQRNCVVSYGTSNRFKHPSEKTLLTLHFQNEILVPVEEATPAYKQDYVW